ncbi:GumC family protein [Nitratireductor sp. XY-223]|uniref:GumC family protein n=1 Tax=Nitratireductor sp. XY-223 TaxID=2561926 RepID=UPI0010AA817A|nr:GumC family protein [Nitratireductor sp. XY-223]
MFDPDTDGGTGRRRSLLDFTRDRRAGAAGEEHAPVDNGTARDELEDIIGVRKSAGEAPVDRQALIERIRAAAGDIREDGAAAMSGNDAPAMPGHGTSAAGKAGAMPAGQPAAPSRTGGGGGSGPRDGALVDPVTLIATAWHHRLFIIFMTLLGAALGVMLALSTPHKYEAVSQLVLDPRELRLTDTDFLPQSYSAEAMLALVDSQVKIVNSSPVLQTVVDDLDLADDPEFNGLASAGIGGVVGFVRDLFTGQGDAQANRNFLAVQSLSRDVAVYRGEKTFIVYVSVTTEDPGKSALIANRIVDVYIAKQREAQSALFERTSAALTRQLDELRQDVEAAETRVEQYKADNDLVDAGGSLISDEQIIRLNQQLAQLRAQRAEVQVRAETASQLDIDSVLSGTAPEILQSSTIGELRAEYAGAKRAADALATSLGPRHPQRIAAEQALKTARSEIRNELRRIVEATQTELRRIVQSEQQLAADLAILKSKQVTTSTDLVRLRELEREASATSAIYESFLKRARETREQQNLNTSNIRVISEATPPIKPTGPSRKIIAAGGAVLGFLAGLAVVMMLGAYRSLASGIQRGAAPVPGPAPAPAGPGIAVEEPPQPAPAAELPPVVDTPSPGGQGERAAHQGAEDDWPQQPILGPGDPDFEDDAESIRHDIRQVREAVERLKKAREEARIRGTYASH